MKTIQKKKKKKKEKQTNNSNELGKSSRKYLDKKIERFLQK